MISESNDQVSIFVDWSKNPQVIGHYWFIIERAYLGTPNVIFQLRILRYVLIDIKVALYKISSVLILKMIL